MGRQGYLVTVDTIQTGLILSGNTLASLFEKKMCFNWEQQEETGTV